MSRQNKVNPGMYTQRGRLTQDDAARELTRQRSIGSQHTWQPVQKDAMPRLESKDENADAETSEDTEREIAAPVKAKAKKSKTAKTIRATKATAKAKSAKPSAKAKATKTVRRQAVLARNVGGGAPKPRRATKKRKS